MLSDMLLEHTTSVEHEHVRGPWRDRERESARSEFSIRMLIGMKSFTHTDLVEYQEDVVERDRADEV